MGCQIDAVKLEVCYIIHEPFLCLETRQMPLMQHIYIYIAPYFCIFRQLLYINLLKWTYHEKINKKKEKRKQQHINSASLFWFVSMKGGFCTLVKSESSA